MAKQPENEDDLTDLDASEEESKEFEDEDLFEETEDEDLFTEEEMETTIEPSAPPVGANKQGLAPAVKPIAPSVESREQPISPEQIPLALTVEVGQIQMTMDQVLKLEPGNLLEIDIHPEKGVDLTINGKVVGKGELIVIGETLGVRVLQVGR
jgi:flagellar motor switch protein FliN